MPDLLAAGHPHAVHAADDRLLAVEDRVDHVVEQVHVLAVLVRALRSSTGEYSVRVSAGAERRVAGAGEDDRHHAAVARGGVEPGDDALDHLGGVGVVLRGVVQRDPGHVEAVDHLSRRARPAGASRRACRVPRVPQYWSPISGGPSARCREAANRGSCVSFHSRGRRPSGVVRTAGHGKGGGRLCRSDAPRARGRERDKDAKRWGVARPRTPSAARRSVASPRLALPADDHSHGRAASAADGGDAQLAVGALEGMIQRDQQTCSRAPGGMPQGNGAAVDVQLSGSHSSTCWFARI